MAAEDDRPKVEIKPNEDGSCATFIVDKEDHTLGNALRYTVMRDRRTEFCGYTIPHPSETCIHVRLQTRRGESAPRVLQDGFTTLIKACDHMQDVFAEALAASAAEGVDMEDE